MSDLFTPFPCTPKEMVPPCVSVLGLGVTGREVSLFLAEKGCRVVASDPGPPQDSDAELLEAGITVIRGQNRVEAGDLVVISPGIPPHSPVFQEALERGREVISGPELFARLSGVPIIAISGTDGKSTVTTWLEALFQEAGLNSCAGGNLGTPMVKFLREGTPMDVAIIEISAFQLPTSSRFSPAVAVMTNVVDDHLDYFQGNADAYRNAKRHLLNLCRPEAVFVYDTRDPVVSAWEAPEGVIPKGLHDDSGINPRVEEGRILHRGRRIVEESQMVAQGHHNLINAAMVYVVGTSLGIPEKTIIAALQNYRPLPHRCEPLGTFRGIRYINDSKATSPHAVMSALRGRGHETCLLLGGSDKGVDFEELLTLIRRKSIRCFPFGKMGSKLSQWLDVPGYADLRAAFQAAHAVAQSGDTVLLSPACASFDQYQSYAHRGDEFRSLVKAIT